MPAEDLATRAIYQSIEIVPYDARWPAEYQAERHRLLQLCPETFSAMEHVGSTAVVGLAAKPIIDMIAVVPTIEVADTVMTRLVEFSYIFSADFNVRLGDSRWLMKHSNGQRTHHLHLVLPESEHWTNKIRFRDLLRTDSTAASRYVALKRELAQKHSQDRETYTEAKTDFVSKALALLANRSTQPTAGRGN